MIDVLSSPVAHSLTLTLLHFLWQGVLIGLLYWLLTIAFSEESAQTGYAAALVALSTMAVCPVITFCVVYESDPISVGAVTRIDDPSLPAYEMKPAIDDSADPVSGAASHASRVVIARESDFMASSTSARSLAAAIHASQPYLLLMWLAGVIFSLARLASGLIHVIWLRAGRLGVPAALASRSNAIAQRLGLQTVRLYASNRVRMAAVVGFIKPAVLLPASWLTELPPSVLESVIAHELAHIRRCDVWVNLFQRLMESAFFYHPIVWWISNQLRFERELCCDALAVEATGDRGNYVMALEQVGRLEVHGTFSLTPAISGDRGMKLLSRIQYILGIRNPQREPSWLLGIATMASLVIGAALIASVGDSSSVVAQEREGGRSAEAEAGARRSAEAEAAGRQSAESESPRRSAEGDAGTGRSAERDGEARRSAERERAVARDGEPRRASLDALIDFKPQTDREATLLQMIVQLQREVALLRQEVRGRGDGDGRSRDGEGDGRMSDLAEARRDDDATARNFAAFQLPTNWQETKEGRVFKAYDKNADEIVSLDEWLAMTNGNISPARREIGTKHFNAAEPSGDGRFTPAEFIWWREIGSKQSADGARQQADREDADRGRGQRDGEREPRGPRDGEGEQRGPRDGEGSNSGPRDRDRE